MSEVIQIPERVHLRVLSTEEVLFEGDVQWVQVPLQDGLVGIWPGHAPLIASLTGGGIQFGTEGGVRELGVESGILHVDVEHCTILVSPLPFGDRGVWRTDTDELVERMEQELLETLSGEELRELQEQERAGPG